MKRGISIWMRILRIYGLLRNIPHFVSDSHKVMNLYMKHGDFKVITATFTSTNKRHKEYLESIGYVRTEKQICVHDTDCIVYNELEVMS